jgi:hypothetical protein
VKRHVLQSALVGGAVGYLVTIGIYFAPTSWPLSPAIVFGLCSPLLASFTVDPSFTAVASVFVPLNALLYGAVGALIGVCTRSQRPHAG